MFYREMFSSYLPRVSRLTTAACAVGLFSLSLSGCDGTFSGTVDIGNPDIAIDGGDTDVNVETNVNQEQDVTVNIGDNENPTAVVSTGTQISAQRGDEVSLDASGSTPGTGGGSLSFSWVQITTFNVIIRNGADAIATVGIPFDIPNGAQIVMLVTVTAGSRADDTQVTIVVEGGEDFLPTTPGDECETDLGCGDGDDCTDDVCLGGVCEFFNNGLCDFEFECNVDEDCETGDFCTTEFCDGGFCVFELTDCGPGFFCDSFGQQCLPFDVECFSDFDCDFDGNLCTFEFCEGGFCTDGGNIDCGLNSVCEPGSGTCVPINTGEFCSDECFAAFDGDCDDGGPGSNFNVCPLGSDCFDCGSRGQNELCSNDCPTAGDFECDDGGFGSLFAICPLGTDCDDCGARTFICFDECFTSFDGICNDGGLGSITNTCAYGTDCFDCGARDANVMACNDDSFCDDGEFCNGFEECLFGVCFTGFEPCSASEECDEFFDVCNALP